MIQRIQSLFIVAAAGLGISLFFVPVIVFAGSEELFIVNAAGFTGANIWYFSLLSILCILPLFIQLFMYNNRKKQILIGKISILMWILWILLFMLIVYLNEIANFSLQFGAIFPFLIVIFILLANRNIKKDEELIRSIDRIR